MRASVLVLPILLYGSETWTLIQADWRRLDSFILHVSWHDFEVLRRTGLLDVTCSLSYTNEDRVSSATLPDFRMLYWQISSFEYAPRRETVSGHHRNGDVLAVDHAHHLDPLDLP